MVRPERRALLEPSDDVVSSRDLGLEGASDAELDRFFEESSDGTMDVSSSDLLLEPYETATEDDTPMPLTRRCERDVMPPALPEPETSEGADESP